MHTIINLIAIQIIIVFIVDLSGWTESWKSALSYIITKGKIKTTDYRLKPFDCSLCTTFWAIIIYLICTNNLCLIYVLSGCILALLTPAVNDLLILAKDMISKMIRTLYEILKLNE